VSPVVHDNPSLHAAPVFTVPTQAPPEHASELVHGLPSLQAVPLLFGV
jgi:hypothetical protein